MRKMSDGSFQRWIPHDLVPDQNAHPISQLVQAIRRQHTLQDDHVGIRISPQECQEVVTIPAFHPTRTDARDSKLPSAIHIDPSGLVVVRQKIEVPEPREKGLVVQDRLTILRASYEQTDFVSDRQTKVSGTPRINLDRSGREIDRLIVPIQRESLAKDIRSVHVDQYFNRHRRAA